jgi:PAS domain S-box-containing protein
MRTAQENPPLNNPAEPNAAQDLIDLEPSGLAIVNGDYRLTALNRAWVGWMDQLFQARPVTGDALLEIIPDPRQRETLRKAIDLALAGTPANEVMSGGNLSGGDQTLALHCTPIHNKAGEIHAAALRLSAGPPGPARTAIGMARRVESQLLERNKELTCLNEIGRLMEDANLTEKKFCEGVLSLMINAMQFPLLTAAQIDLAGRRYQAGSYSSWIKHKLSARILAGGRPIGQIRLHYHPAQPAYLPEEQSLLNNIASMLGMWHDRNRSQAEALQLSQAIEHSPLAVIILNPEWKIEFTNSAFSLMTGYIGADVSSRDPDFLMAENVGEDARTQFIAALNTGQVLKSEFMGRRKDGSTFWAEAAMASMLYRDGTRHYIHFISDISARKQEETLAKDALELKFKMLQAAPSGILIYKHTGECVQANPAAAQIAGTTTDILLTQNFKHLASWKITNLYDTAMQTLESWQAVPVETQITTSFGKNAWLRGSFTPFLSSGEAHLLFIFEDNTERKLAELALFESRQRYRSLFDDAPLMIWEEDFSPVWREFERLRANGVLDFRAYLEDNPDEVKRLVALVTILDVNPETLRFYEVSDTRELTNDLASYAVHDSWIVFREEMIALAEGRTTFESEVGFMSRRGTRKELYIKLAVPPTSVGNLSRVIVSFIDITARKNAEAALLNARDELEKRVEERTAELNTANQSLARALRARDEFLAAVSHELRTPLTGILGISQTLQAQLVDVLTPKQALALQTIEKSGRRLHSLINDVLDYSRLQGGRLELQKLKFSLEHACHGSLQSVSAVANEKNQELVYHSEPHTITLRADERRVKQILVNLLDNAIKFSPAGGRIELFTQLLPGERFVQLIVKDNGIGIPAEELQRLFQPFIQLDAQFSRLYGGTGLGLAMVRMITELHGGRVEVQSEPGQGSTFKITLPVE